MQKTKVRKKIKAILVDIDNTLIPTRDFTKIARESAINALLIGGLKVEKNILIKKLEEVVDKYDSNYTNHFDRMLEELGVPKRLLSKLVAKAKVAYHNTKPILLPYPDVPSTLYLLKEARYNLYAASEGNSKSQWEKLIRTNLDVILKDAFMTEDFGFKLKEAAFFKVILHEIKLKGEQCLMIGDRLDKDIKPAKENEIHTVRILTERHKKDKALDSEVKPDYEIKRFSEILDILPKIEEKL